MVEIFSKVNEEVIDGVKVSYKYWIDEYDVYWIRYVDMISFLGLSDQKANALMYEIEANNDRCDFEDNEFDKFGKRSLNIRTFITRQAVNYLIERNDKHNNIFVKSVNNLGSDTNNEEEIDDIINNMKKCMEDCNLDALIYNSGKLYNSEFGRDRMYSLGFIDKNVEDNIDKIREVMLNDDVINILLMDNNDLILSELNKENEVWNFNKWMNQ